jgi:hypothetical protein
MINNFHLQLSQSPSGGFFHIHHAVFSSILKSRVSLILAKAAAVRITLNLDGAPITSTSHTHPSHSQTSTDTHIYILSLALALLIHIKQLSTIVSGLHARSSHSCISHLLTSSLSLGISSLFCRATQWI